MTRSFLEVEGDETKLRWSRKAFVIQIVAVIGLVAAGVLLAFLIISLRNGSDQQASSHDSKKQVAAPWWIVNQIIPAGPARTVGTAQESTFHKKQQKAFGIDDQGKVKDQEQFDTELTRVKQTREEVQGKVEEVPLADFDKWRAKIPDSKVVHLKGSGNGMGTFYNEEVLALLKKTDCKLLVWDGDPLTLDGSSFTAMIPHFLRSNPTAKAVAFKLNYEVDKVRASWASTIKQFPGRIAIVPVNLIEPDLKDAEKFGVIEEMKTFNPLPGGWQEYFLLGRIASKLTRSKLVIALGGGDIAAKEAEVGVKDGQEWHVFALSRFSWTGLHWGAGEKEWKKETHPSLLDWAATETEKNNDKVKLIRGKDPHEDYGFGAEATKRA